MTTVVTTSVIVASSFVAKGTSEPAAVGSAVASLAVPVLSDSELPPLVPKVGVGDSAVPTDPAVFAAVGLLASVLGP